MMTWFTLLRLKSLGMCIYINKNNDIVLSLNPNNNGPATFLPQIYCNSIIVLEKVLNLDSWVWRKNLKLPIPTIDGLWCSWSIWFIWDRKKEFSPYGLLSFYLDQDRVREPTCSDIFRIAASSIFILKLLLVCSMLFFLKKCVVLLDSFSVWFVK